MFIVLYCVFLLGCSLYLLLGRTYTTPIAFELYFKGLSLSFGLATSYFIWEHQNFPLNNFQMHTLYSIQSPRILMFGNIWKAHDSSPWKNNFINGIRIHNQSPWFKLMAIHSSKTQFSLVTSRLNSHWQHQSPILIGTTLSKRKEPKIINTWQRKKISC